MRKQRMRMTISNKITLMYGGVFAIAILLINAVVFVNLYMFYRSLSKNEMAETITKVIEHIKEGGDISDEAISSINPNKYVKTDVLIIDSLDSNTSGQAQNPPFRFEDVRVARPSESWNIPKGVISRIINFTFEEQRFEHNGHVYLILTYRSFDREHQIAGIFYSLFILSSVFGVVGAFLIGRYISRKMLRPITDLIKLASEISIDDLNRRIEIDGPDDEINLLAKTFNDMIGRLSVSFEKQSRFVSDASHELRTPISVIQGYANLLARWGKDDPEILTESIESIKSETERMSALVKKLLYMAGDIGEGKQAARDYLNLNECVKDILKEISVMELPHEIRLVESADVFIYADKDLIRQMLWIFIENSMKYCKNNKTDITVTLYTDEGNNYVSIKDDGIGIKEKDLPHIFERFYRGDKSRSKAIIGTGLGLSIAESIIKSHNAKVSVMSKPDHGTQIIISFEK